MDTKEYYRRLNDGVESYLEREPFTYYKEFLIVAREAAEVIARENPANKQ